MGVEEEGGGVGEGVDEGVGGGGFWDEWGGGRGMRGLEMMMTKVDDSIRRENCLGFVVGSRRMGKSAVTDEGGRTTTWVVGKGH